MRVFFFFQAEDGIRDVAVTGVQTCALPICDRRPGASHGAAAARGRRPTDRRRAERRQGPDPPPLAREMSPAALLAALAIARADTVPPVLQFPDPGLDDPAAYEGYVTRVYRDARGNASQVYLRGASGRVVNLWADAADESVGFTVRDSTGRPAQLAWDSAAGGAVVAESGRTRSLSYGLELPSSVTVGLFLLGSMRVERDFQYAGRDSLPLDATPFPQHE